MADAISIQELIDARTDAKTLEEAVNGDAVTTVLSRLGESYPTLANALSQIDGKLDSADAQIKQGITSLFENGGLPATPFATKALMESSELVDGDYAMVTDDTVNNGLYVKTAGAWVKSSYDPLAQAKAYVDATNLALVNQVNSDVAAQVAAVRFDVMTGTEIYYKAEDNPQQVFSAIWSEYSKPVWHIGNRTIVDVTGATVSVVKEQLVFTIKLTEANQTFVYPTRANNIPEQYARVDWGDGIVADYTNYNIDHQYVGDIGDEFQIKVTGNPLHFDFALGRRTSALMLKSIDSNTLPKTMPFFNISGCDNLKYLGRGAFSSWTGTSFNAQLAKIKDLVLHKDAFKGMSQVTNIDNLLSAAGVTMDLSLPAGLLDPFVNVTSAKNIFYGLSKPLPVGIFDKMTKLEDVEKMFYRATVTTLDSRIFKNQTKLKTVTQCFRLADSMVVDAFQLYTDMNQGAPASVSGCFANVNSMTNLAQVPSAWKSL